MLLVGWPQPSFCFLREWAILSEGDPGMFSDQWNVVRKIFCFEGHQCFKPIYTTVLVGGLSLVDPKLRRCGTLTVKTKNLLSGLCNLKCYCKGLPVFYPHGPQFTLHCVPGQQQPGYLMRNLALALADGDRASIISNVFKCSIIKIKYQKNLQPCKF